jgi:hypothetical protein
MRSGRARRASDPVRHTMARVVLLSSTTRYALCSATAASLVVATLVSSPSTPPSARAQARPPSRFATEIASLSEPAGYFDTDNLISNERSYLHAMTDLSDAHLHGGAYIGVGPDQNFSYIAQIRPTVAFIIDIRRDNLLLHLLFKALFALGRTRVDYLALLLGRPTPAPLTGWDTKSIDELVAYLDGARPLTAQQVDALRARVTSAISAFGVPLSAADLETIDRFHRQFIADGLSLRFHTTGRPPQNYDPAYRDLLLEVDRAGHRRSFLAVETDFQFIKVLEARDQVIPVVGDLGGPSALQAIGRSLTARQTTLSAFYASNVEFYLFRDGTFGRFVRNLGEIPHADGAILIRSVFGGAGRPLPGSGSVSLSQPIRALLDGYARGEFRNYWELATWSSRAAVAPWSDPREWSGVRWPLMHERRDADERGIVHERGSVDPHPFRNPGQRRLAR